MSGIDREIFLQGYLAEVEEHLGAVVRHLGAIGAGGDAAQPRAVREMFRSLHTIKGLSAMVNVEPIVEIAHAMEIVVRAGEKAGGRLPRRAVDLLAEGIAAIEQRLRQVVDRTPITAAPGPLVDALEQMDRDPSILSPAAPVIVDEPALTASDREQIAQGVAEGRTCTRIDLVSTRERSEAGLTITAVRERVGQVADIIRILPRALQRDEHAPAGLGFSLYVLHAGDPAPLAEAAGVEVSQLVRCAGRGAEAPEPAADAPEPAGEVAKADDNDPIADSLGGRFVRVDVSRLDEVLEQLSALIVNRFRLGRAVADLASTGADVRPLHAILHESSRQLRGLRTAVMHARMVSVAELLERTPLIVRGLTRSTGKEVTLAVEAGRAELDKAVGERIFPAIVHLVRNAVDHGIETPAVRRAAGKPVEGHIRIACHERNNNQLELTVADDGRGIDVVALARRGGRATPKDDDELLDLLATPGLSSRSEVTTTSGRGVGVDIVQRIVRELGGTLRVTTAAGAGTTFTLRIPLSITIVEAFSFESAGQTFLVPVSTVDEIVEIDPARTARTPQRPGARAEVSLIERRGVAVPVVSLDEVFALSRQTAQVSTGLLPKAFVVRRGGAPCAFQVDRVLGQQEVVVRPIVDELIRVDGVTGSTDLGDGKPVLMLDLVALADRLADEGRPRDVPWRAP